MNDVVVDILRACPVCGGKESDRAVELPAFPLTGIYVDRPDAAFPTPDQALLICRDCGHGYLENVIDPGLLYQETYTHRTSGSPIARAGNDFFWNFIVSTIGERRFAHALEIGCNDLYLMSRLAERSTRAVGVDPIWIDRTPPQTPDNVRVRGAFIADFDVAADMEGAPDLIVSAHTFEHVADAGDQLARVIAKAAPEALCFIEVPCLDTQLSNFRFDQVFHQHIQYFSVASLKTLFRRLGCRYVAHAVNHRYWGGTLMMCGVKKTAGPLHDATPGPAVDEVKRRYAIFQQRYRALRDELEAFDGPVYGYGAAQMTPTVAYHLDGDLRFMKALLDDNPDRVGRWLPGLRPGVIASTAADDLHDAGIMITALDSYRGVVRRVLDINPRTIFASPCRF